MIEIRLEKGQKRYSFVCFFYLEKKTKYNTNIMGIFSQSQKEQN